MYTQYPAAAINSKDSRETNLVLWRGNQVSPLVSGAADDGGVGLAAAMYWIQLTCRVYRARGDAQGIGDYRAAGTVQQANKIRAFVMWIMAAIFAEAGIMPSQ